MTLITGIIADSAGSPANGRIEFTQASRIDTGSELVTGTTATAQVVEGELRTLDGSAFDMPVNPDGTAVRVREILGGRTTEWWTQIPVVGPVEYRSLVPVEPIGQPMYAPPPWLAGVLQARDAALAASAAAASSASSASSAKTAAEAARNEAQAVGNTNDTIMTSVANNGSSAFAGALAGKIDTAAVMPKARGVFLDVTKYGADPLGSADSTSAIQAALTAAGSVAVTPGLGGTGLDAFGCTVFFPAGHYKTTAPLTVPSNVVVRGAGMRSARIFNNASALFAWSGQIQRVAFSDIYLSTGTAGGHVFDMGTDGAIAIARFTNVAMYVRNATSSLWKQTGTTGRSFIDVRFDGCELDRAGGTVPAINVSMPGNQANNITFANCWAHGHGTTAAPFFRIESTDTWNYAITFRDITGEQNGGGLIHLYNASGVTIDNCPDWDFAGAYQGSVFFLGGTVGCVGVTIKHSKRIKGGTLAAGVYDIDASAAANRKITIEDCDFWNGTQGTFNLTSYCELLGLTGSTTPEGAVAAPPGALYTRTTGGNGAPLKYAKRTGLGATGWVPQGTAVQAYATKTANYTVDVGDEVLIFNGSSLTATLPPGATVGAMRKVTIKNVHSTALTVATSPGLIDGAASVSLAQWQSKTFVTDGSNSWLSI